MDFPIDFFKISFVNVLQTLFYQRQPLEAFLYHRMVSS